MTDRYTYSEVDRKSLVFRANTRSAMWALSKAGALCVPEVCLIPFNRICAFHDQHVKDWCLALTFLRKGAAHAWRR